MIIIANFREEQYPETSATRCVQIIIPDDDAFAALMAGLLALPGNELNYQQLDDDKAAALAAQWRDAYVTSDWRGCAVSTPIGAVISNPSDTPDAGWLLCDGTQYNRADYPALAALIPEGTPNIGGDSTVFFVPNLTGRVLMGAGDTAVSPATGAAMGILGGSPTVALGINDIPSHNHNVYSGDGYTLGTAGATGAMLGGGSLSGTKTGNAGNGSAPTHANMQPYFALYVWIYAGL